MFWTKIAIYLSLGLPKERPSYRSFQPSKENIQHFKTWIFFCFFLFLWVISAPLDPDLATQINADTDPQPCHILVHTEPSHLCLLLELSLSLDRERCFLLLWMGEWDQERRPRPFSFRPRFTSRSEPGLGDRSCAQGGHLIPLRNFYISFFQCCGSGMMFCGSGSYFSVGFGYKFFFNSLHKFYFCIPALYGKCVRLLTMTRYMLFRGIFCDKKKFTFSNWAFLWKLSNFTSFSEQFYFKFI